MTNGAQDPSRPNPARVDQIRRQVVRRPSRGRTSTAGRIASASLATMTCIGLAGVLAVRAAEDSNAATAAAPEAGSVAAPTSSTGLTQEQLDAYAQQLQDQAQQLADYRGQLIDVAAQLQAVADSQGIQVRTQDRSGQVTRKPSPSTKKPKPRPAAKPPSSPTQGQTQGS